MLRQGLRARRAGILPEEDQAEWGKPLHQLVAADGLTANCRAAARIELPSGTARQCAPTPIGHRCGDPSYVSPSRR